MGSIWLGKCVVICAIAANQAEAKEHLVHSQADFAHAVRQLQPGDIVTLADGEWRDFRILFQGHGAPGKPIVLRAQTKGRVFITGDSNLRLAGEYLLVSGLVFRDGHSPTGDVIAFRASANAPASHSRLTEVVIDRFNPPDRRKEDRWISFYGQENRVDHSHFEGKNNAGVTLAVIRETGQPPDDRHRIDHNYFGPRPPLGANGGETIRIGTSEQSLSDSHSIVEDNYFDRCDGEVEIISVKSGGNIIRNNVIHESQGSIVLRHGNGNLVERNIFFGNGKPHTGGIRIINARQIVRGNYMEGLAGTDFASAIAVMNGVPNSPINRYHQVQDALIEGNSLIDVARITLGAGADAERSAPPLRSRFERNLLIGRAGEVDLRVETDIAGIGFAGNIQSAASVSRLTNGIDQRSIQLARASNGLLYPVDPAIGAVGAPRDLKPIARADSGVAWYPKPAATKPAFGTGATIELAPSGDALRQAVARAKGGDTIRLSPGRYNVDAPVTIDRAITIAGPGPAAPAMLTFARSSLFQIAEGGQLRLEGLTISGVHAPAAPGNVVIRGGMSPMASSYTVEIENVRFVNLDGAPGFDVIATTPSAFADHIAIRSSRFENVSGSVVAARGDGDGHYGVEQVDIAASIFRKVGQVAELSRGGRDESSFGPRFSLRDSDIVESGLAAGASVRLSGVQIADIGGNRFTDSAPIDVTHSVGTPGTRIAGNIFRHTPMPAVKELYFRGPPRAALAGNVAEGAN
ncbi:poly(beta-D-mannuronate) lyase [Sphingomonas oleivorans]|uniref:Poly(Beta-D-mannuronate) lyase n=1 Tax=Sphingomonas oleivorans TaxID=1735121 RepID=A0A2T5FUL9_9SPHN|nr:polysaccharide lyase 6 family protein [Sphingomonas oleivorans]PTQ08221.1 poly(beta-D-mannuronate) lyase [Sphingomonas oleivorans]